MTCRLAHARSSALPSSHTAREQSTGESGNHGLPRSFDVQRPAATYPQVFRVDDSRSPITGRRPVLSGDTPEKAGSLMPYASLT